MNELILLSLGVVVSLQGWILLSVISLKVDMARVKQTLGLD
jgi:hypothetical protein